MKVNTRLFAILMGAPAGACGIEELSTSHLRGLVKEITGQGVADRLSLYATFEKIEPVLLDLYPDFADLGYKQKQSGLDTHEFLLAIAETHGYEMDIEPIDIGAPPLFITAKMLQDRGIEVEFQGSF